MKSSLRVALLMLSCVPRPALAEKADGATFHLRQARALHAELSQTARPHDASWHAYQLTREEGVGFRSGFFRGTKHAFSPQLTLDTRTPTRVRVNPWLDGTAEIFVEQLRGEIVVGTRPLGYNPGETFIVTKTGLFRLGVESGESMPTVGSHGGLAWSVPRDRQTNERIPASAQDRDRLGEILTRIAAIKREHTDVQAKAPPRN